MTILEKYGVSDRYITEAGMHPELTLGRVIAQHRGGYRIVTLQGEFMAEISGRLRYTTDELAKFPAVGDFVMADCSDSCVIHRILTRKSVFLRRAVGVSGQAQVVAANIDVVFICMSLNNNFNLSRLERYLAVAWDSGAKPVVVLTKSDLCRDLSESVAKVRQAAAFCDVLTVSMLDESTIERLAPYLATRATGAFIGSSGVGKSTLINMLLNSHIATGGVGKNDKGRHTTTGRELFPCPFGGVVIDTPGMRELGAESADLSKTFVDIEELEKSCRFSDCTHSGEPGCAVMQALLDGVIDQRRLDSYVKLKNETGYDGMSSREIENKKFDRMFKDVGGMKNARRFAAGKNKH